MEVHTTIEELSSEREKNRSVVSRKEVRERQDTKKKG